MLRVFYARSAEEFIWGPAITNIATGNTAWGVRPRFACEE
jgi:hypothetical protein